MHSTLSILVLALGTLGSAKTISVDVGKAGLKFDPNNFKADVGDEIEFEFYPQDHR
jgi:plastocyanin